MEIQLKLASRNDGEGDATMDMQAYVEFQQTLDTVLKTHRAALAATRRFWRLLERSRITFKALRCSFVVFMSIDRSDSACNRQPYVLSILFFFSGTFESVHSDRYIGMDLNRSAAFVEMDAVELKAERAYVAVLEKHPKNIKLLRAYARFRAAAAQG